MANRSGSFIWYELMTPDPDGMGTFYAAVVGWTIAAPQPNQAGGMDYRMIGRADGGFAGGVLRLTADMLEHGARPMWMGYLSTPDVDRQVAAIVGEGGTLQLPATDIPNVGRIAMLTDPQGVPFYVMTPVPPQGQHDATSDVFDRHASQHVNWNELASPDLPASKAFYSRQFGFEFKDTMSMGPMGDYCFIDHDGQRLGAIMQRQDERQPAAWLFYFGVPSIEVARRAIESNGGAVLMGPHEVPTGEWILLATDPAGAGFGLTGPRGA